MDTDLGPETIRLIRTRARLTREEFAASLGVSQSVVAKWENGDRNPRPRHVRAIEDFGSVSPDDRIVSRISVALQGVARDLTDLASLVAVSKVTAIGEIADRIASVRTDLEAVTGQDRTNTPSFTDRLHAEQRFQFIARLLPSLEFATSRNRTVIPTAILAEAGDDPVLADLVDRYQTIDVSSHQSIHQDIVTTGHELLAIAPDAPGVAEMIARSEQETR